MLWRGLWWEVRWVMVQGVECAHVVYPLDLNLLAFCQEPSVVARNYNGASVAVTFLHMPLWHCFFDKASALPPVYGR